MLVIHHRVPPWPPPSPTMATTESHHGHLHRIPSAARRSPAAAQVAATATWPRSQEPSRSCWAKRCCEAVKWRAEASKKQDFRGVFGEFWCLFMICEVFFRLFRGFFSVSFGFCSIIFGCLFDYIFVGFFLGGFSIISRGSETGNPVWVKSSCFVWICDYRWTALEFPSRLIWDKGQKLKTPHMMQSWKGSSKRAFDSKKQLRKKALLLLKKLPRKFINASAETLAPM